jgi:hypothetical protein
MMQTSQSQMISAPELRRDTPHEIGMAQGTLRLVRRGSAIQNAAALSHCIDIFYRQRIRRGTDKQSAAQPKCL